MLGSGSALPQELRCPLKPPRLMCAAVALVVTVFPLKFESRNDDKTAR
jgi:hypothetical protein